MPKNASLPRERGRTVLNVAGKERAIEDRLTSRAKIRAALTSLGFNLLVTAFKLLAAAVTGSVSLLSDAVHSATDIVASSLAVVSVRVSAAPPDEEHPFGHGKIESLTGFAEAIMIVLIVIYIVYEAFGRLLTRHQLPQEKLGFGMIVIGACAAGSLLVSLVIGGIAKRTTSTALLVNAGHLRTDFITSLGVFAGLAITRITGWEAADPVVAILLAGWIAFGAYGLCAHAFHELIDVRLSEMEIQDVKAILNSEKRLISYHRLRTRRSGSVSNVDLHIVVPSDWSVVQAHALADDLERRIRERLKPAEVVIHVDPYDVAKDTGG